MKLSVSGKLTLGFSVVLTFMLILGVFAINRMDAINATGTEIADNWLPSVAYVGDINTATSDFRIAETRHILATTEEHMKRFKDDMTHQQEIMDENLKKYEPVATTPEEKQLLATFKSKWAEYLVEHAKIEALSVQNKTEEARAILRTTSQDLFVAANNELVKIVQINRKGGEDASKRGDEMYSRSMTLTVSCLAIAMLFGIGFAIYLSRDISRTLTAAVKQIESGSSQIGAASSQMSVAAQNLSAGTAEAAASLEESVASLEELTSMVKLNSENAKQAGALANESRVVADEGNIKIKSLVNAMQEITAGSKKVSEITDVIDDIAFQTNLLALNAAVEAARAGDQGKGFAVVAEAVRALAQRSAAAAKDISVLITESLTKTENGARFATESEIGLKAILESVKKVSDLNSEISTASQEQASGLAQINAAITQLDQSTQTNASASQEVAATSEELSSQASAFIDVIDELKAFVNGGNAAPTQAPLVFRTQDQSKPAAQSRRAA